MQKLSVWLASLMRSPFVNNFWRKFEFIRLTPTKQVHLNKKTFWKLSKICKRKWEKLYNKCQFGHWNNIFIHVSFWFLFMSVQLNIVKMQIISGVILLLKSKYFTLNFCFIKNLWRTLTFCYERKKIIYKNKYNDRSMFIFDEYTEILLQ